MTTIEGGNRVDTKQNGYSVLMWTFAIASWAIGEAVLVFMQIRLHSRPTSILFWYLPFAISAPLSIGVDVYRRLKKLLGDSPERSLAGTLSYNIALLAVVANITITICATSLMTGGF